MDVGQLQVAMHRNCHQTVITCPGWFSTAFSFRVSLKLPVHRGSLSNPAKERRPARKSLPTFANMYHQFGSQSIYKYYLFYFIYLFKINDTKTRGPLILSEVHVHEYKQNIHHTVTYKKRKTYKKESNMLGNDCPFRHLSPSLSVVDNECVCHCRACPCDSRVRYEYNSRNAFSDSVRDVAYN